MRKKRKEAVSAFGDVPEDALEFSVNPGDENADDVLLHSLDNMSEKDVSPDARKKSGKREKKKKSGGVIRNIILIVSIAVFVACAVWLVDNLIQKKKGADETDSLRREFFSGTSFAENGRMDEYDPGTGAICRLHAAVSADRVLCLSDRIAQNANPSSGDHNKDLDQIRAGITGLASKNPDTFGWITIPDSHIDHPIVQGDNNEWYLDHSFLGDYLVTGSIFADYRNDRSIMKNFNTVLYGHNITTGDMFHDVTKFLDEDYFNTTLIYIYTMEGVYVYEPFSVFEARSDYNYFRTEFASTDDFIAFAREMRDNSRFVKDIDFVSTDRMLTLSTCTNGMATQRWCLQAKLVQVIN